MTQPPIGFSSTSINVLVSLGLIVLLAACGGVGGSSDSTYRVTASALGGGSITPERMTVREGESASFSIKAKSGFGIDSAFGCGGSYSDGEFTTGAITADCNIEAQFSAINPPEIDTQAQASSVTRNWNDSDGA